jgi:tetratricopeptide (TPR) repeat protein
VRTFLVLLLCLGAASASGEERALVRAERLFEALEFDKAAQAFQEALREPGSREERIRTWKGLALSEAFMGLPKKAQADFEALLSIDPDVQVNRGLGPKIRRPYDAARKRMRNKPRPELQVTRRQDGQVEAVLERPTRLVMEVAVFVREPGETAFKATRSVAPGPVVAPASAVRAVEAYAVALDATEGVLFEKGSAAAPLRFNATEEPLPAVAAAQEPPPEQAPLTLEPERRAKPKWPLVVGGVGLAVAAGVVAGIVLSQPPTLKLPQADRTERLP